MKENEVAWCFVSKSIHNEQYDDEILYRIEVLKVDPIKISFPELPYESQKQMLMELK